MEAPSKSLNDSAKPFDAGCMAARHLEEAAVDTLVGRDWHRLSTNENKLCDLLVEFKLIEVRSGYVKRI